MSDLYRCSKCGYYHNQPVTSDWECRQHHKKTEQWIAEVAELEAEVERLREANGCLINELTEIIEWVDGPEMTLYNTSIARMKLKEAGNE